MRVELGLVENMVKKSETADESGFRVISLELQIATSDGQVFEQGLIA